MDLLKAAEQPKKQEFWSFLVKHQSERHPPNCDAEVNINLNRVASTNFVTIKVQHLLLSKQRRVLNLEVTHR